MSDSKSGTYSQVSQTSVDDVVAADVASSIAQSANLPVAPNIANLAVSVKVISKISQASSISTTKPQIIGSGEQNRLVVTYVVKDGDNVDSVAAKFNISPETVKWANNLTSGTLYVGKELNILPLDGTLYTVKSGDTFASIAEKYGVDANRVATFNDLDISGLKPDSKIILPGGVLPDNERPGYVAPVVYRTYGYSGYEGYQWLYSVPYGAYSPGNTSTPGQCTWYAWDRRIQLGLRMPAGAVLGNAAEWNYTLGSYGYDVQYGVPSVGAIMQNGGGVGHVAIVESVSAKGDVTITEMNFSGGSYQVNQRTIPAGSAQTFNYIQ